MVDGLSRYDSGAAPRQAIMSGSVYQSSQGNSASMGEIRAAQKEMGVKVLRKSNEWIEKFSSRSGKSD